MSLLSVRVTKEQQRSLLFAYILLVAFFISQALPCLNTALPPIANCVTPVIKLALAEAATGRSVYETGLPVTGQKIICYCNYCRHFKAALSGELAAFMPEPDIACIPPPGSHAFGWAWLQLKPYYCQN